MYTAYCIKHKFVNPFTACSTELFTRHLLVAVDCSEVAKKGRQDWEELLAHVLQTKPAVVVQDACPVQEVLQVLHFNFIALDVEYFNTVVVLDYL